MINLGAQQRLIIMDHGVDTVMYKIVGEFVAHNAPLKKASSKWINHYDIIL